MHLHKKALWECYDSDKPPQSVRQFQLRKLSPSPALLPSRVSEATWYYPQAASPMIESSVITYFRIYHFQTNTSFFRRSSVSFLATDSDTRAVHALLRLFVFICKNAKAANISINFSHLNVKKTVFELTCSCQIIIDGQVRLGLTMIGYQMR
jgi:hypothetical protein